MPGFTPDLFADPLTGLPDTPVGRTDLAAGAVLLRGFARPELALLLTAIDALLAAAPLRHMQTPGGHTLSVAMSNCGSLGWTSAADGYRYTARDPLSGRPWPALPAAFSALATRAADSAGFPGFVPDACLINSYRPGARMTLHQDRNERDLGAPIVSVSLGLPAIFLFGGQRRHDPVQRIPLAHADVLVWGGPSRLRFHGVLALAEDTHPLLGRQRLNLTFRQAG